MEKNSYLYVKKHFLLAISGCVWLAAGINVARLGILSFFGIQPVSIHYILLTIAVFCLFGIMFFKMSLKHTERILNYGQDWKPIWNFFDLKSYIIMAFMMGGGIWLRSSGLAPLPFIAFFYTGLGCALALAGIVFLAIFFKSHRLNAA